jgi:hypothetical protein
MASSRLIRRTLTTIGWMLGGILTIDLVIGALAPPSLQRYLDYGRSVEAKLDRGMAEGSQLGSGWLDQTCGQPTPADARGISIYGTSFTNHIGGQIERIAPELHVTAFSGPAAPPSHSFACFTRRNHAGIDGNRVQIIGVLASSLRRMATTSGLTTSFEAPHPFTYPRYAVEGGRIIASPPAVATEAELRAVVADPRRWHRYVDGLKETDGFAQRFILLADPLDHSVVGRLIRRAWGQRALRDETARLRGDRGDFDGDPAIITTLRALLIDFARRAEAKGQRPIVLLFDDQGYDGVLKRTIAPTLRARGIAYVLSTDIARADDPANFLSDGHFTPAIDAKMASETINLIRR